MFQEASLPVFDQEETLLRSFCRRVQRKLSCRVSAVEALMVRITLVWLEASPHSHSSFLLYDINTSSLNNSSFFLKIAFLNQEKYVVCQISLKVNFEFVKFRSLFLLSAYLRPRRDSPWEREIPD